MSNARNKMRRDKQPAPERLSPPALPANRWSARSQQSLKRQFELEAKIEKLERNIVFEERKKQAAEANRTRQVNLVEGGQGVYRAALMDSNSTIQSCGQLISTYREQIDKMRAEIAAMQPTPAQAAERSATQEKFAAVAKDCHGEILSLDILVGDVKKKINAILALKNEMRELAAKIDLTSADEFGAEPFKKLLCSLPVSLGPEAARWLAWMLGIEPTKACIIRGEVETYPETLAAAHCYREGDEARLNAASHKVATFEKPYAPTPLDLERGWQDEAIRNRANGTFKLGDPNICLAGSNI